MTPMLRTLEAILPPRHARIALVGIYTMMLLAVLLISGPGSDDTIYIDLRR